MTREEPRRPGRRIVSIMYLSILTLTALFGYVIGRLSPGQIDPVLFGVIQLPPRPIWVAVYGVVTVGLLLGVLLVLVDYVSKKTGAANE